MRFRSEVVAVPGPDPPDDALIVRQNNRGRHDDAQPTPEGRFPLLVKLIHAREPLSVQVHPHAKYVAEHPEARLKTESWYVVEADDARFEPFRGKFVVVR